MSSATLESNSPRPSETDAIKTICELFEEQAAKAPNNIALDYQDKVLSYGQLNETANHLARTIRTQYEKVAGKALTPDTLIPISVGRSADYVIGILGILKAGGAYVPINPEYPDTRIEHILADIDSQIILTNSHLYQKFSAIDARIEPLFMEEIPFIHEEKTNLNQPIKSTDLAYVIYTSGSSGKPKGVMAQHVNVLAQVICASYFKADASDTMTFFSDVSFDSTTFEIWGALLNGARLFIPDDLFNLLSNPRLFKDTLLTKNITILLLTRALFDLLYTLDETVFASLNCLLVGGEALTKNIMLQLSQSKYKPKQVLNAYGPTENSTFCTTYPVVDDFGHLNSVPIGRPYSNRIGLVLDKHLQLMPIGIIGELYVGGPSLSRGYLNQPELTQDRFIANPYFAESGAHYPRIYKTNDLVKWLPDGNLEYSGRNDFQVKLRGYRIELGEIEARLLEFPGIKHGLVLLNSNEGLSYLVGYYVADKPLADDLIRQHLAAALPDYMIPSVFVYLETLPVTTNGKLDRKALPMPQFQPEVGSGPGADASVEQKIAHIWSRVLNLSQLNRDKSFFELGGNSLVAMTIRKELEETFTIQLNIVELFIHTTLTQLSERITALIAESSTKPTQNLMSEEEDKSTQDAGNDLIAVVGMGCRLPGAQNIDAFWQLLVKEQSNLGEFSQENLQASGVSKTQIDSPSYVKRGAVFTNPYAFDAGFFGYSVKDAELMDPQQRQFLECAWEAMEHSGNVPDKTQGDIGVFASEGRNFYFMDHVYPNPAHATDTHLFQAILGNEKDFLSTRVSFKLNLTGPSITLQTACSSSLVAIQMACDSLKVQSCDMALAGGVSLFYNQGYPYQEDMIESPDGYCRAFDAKAKGTVITSGVGVVVLKRLSDAIAQNDTIYAVIKGGAVNNDGSAKMAFTAPSVTGQSAVIEKALRNAKVKANAISYIEAHGTGTTLGDPIEWTALHQVYQKYSNEAEFCTIGAVKTNIGHTDSAAGVFGLMKISMALKHQTLPATLNFQQLNPEIASFNRLFKVSNRTTAWQSTGKKRCAAVSSFGLGGTNAHVIVEEYVEERPFKEKNKPCACYLIPISAKNRESLYAMATQFNEFIATNKEIALSDMAYTAQQGRAEFKERGYFIVSNSANGKTIHSTYLRDQELHEMAQVVLVLSELNKETLISTIESLQGYSAFQKVFMQVSTLIKEKTSLDFNSTALAALNTTTLSHQLLHFATQYALVQLFIQMTDKPCALITEGPQQVLAAALTERCSVSVALDYLLAAKEDGSELALSSNQSIQILDFNALKSGAILNPLYVEIGHAGALQKHNLNGVTFAPDGTQPDEADYLSCLAWSWSHGVAVDWQSMPIACAKKVSLPTYCFSKKQYLIEKYRAPKVQVSEMVDLSTDEVSNESLLKTMWSDVLGVSVNELSDSAHFLELGGDSLSLIDLLKEIEKAFALKLKLEELIKNNEFGAMLRYLESKMV